MQIFRFYPAEFKRQYLVATSLEDALLKEGECFSVYMDSALFYGSPPEKALAEDDWQLDDIIDAYHDFAIRFRQMDVAPVTFLDSHY